MSSCPSSNPALAVSLPVAGPWEARTNNITALRLLLAAMVIVHHSYTLLSRPDPLYASTYLFDFGKTAVDGFFLLSGFLIAQSWLRRRSTWDYLKKRVLRIYPGYLAMVAVCALIVVPLAAAGSAAGFAPWRLRLTLTDALLLRGVHYPGVFAANALDTVNASLWSIPYEFYCYLILAAMGLVGLLVWKRAVRMLWMFTLLAAWCMETAGPTLQLTSHDEALGVWLRVISYFGAGVVFYQYRDSIPRSRGWIAGATVGLALGLVWPALGPLLLPTAGAYLLMSLAYWPNSLLPRLDRLGDYSYGTYLYSCPLQQLLILWLGASIHPLMLLTLSLPATLLCAVLSWHGVEKHFLSRSRKTAPAEPVQTSPLSRIGTNEPQRLAA